MNSGDITVTEARFKRSVGNFIDEVTTPKINDKVDTAVQNERIRTGVITKFYPYLDKAMVRLDSSNEVMLCKILHRASGDMIDFYTPLEAEQKFDDELKEPCVIPKARLHVLVANIHDSDSRENLILGYYLDDEIVGFKPANPGNVKFMSLTESNLYWINFGKDGLKYRLPSEMKSEVGSLKQDMKPVVYVKSDEVYKKAEVDKKFDDIDVDVDLSDYYTKEDVDEKLNEISAGDYDLSEYAKKSDVYEKDDVDGLISNHNHVVSDVSDLPAFTETEIKKGYIQLANGIRDW